MIINNTDIKGVVEVIRSPIEDERGFFERVYCEDFFLSFTSGKKIKQINHSFSKKSGAVRGMHLQIGPSIETKIISCIKGNVIDIALDLRKNSKTFLQWTSLKLSPEKYNSFVLPEGVAHGFQCLTTNCEMIYLHTSNYDPSNDIGININDPLINIQLPLEISEISERDMTFKFLDKNYTGVNI